MPLTLQTLERTHAKKILEARFFWRRMEGKHEEKIFLNPAKTFFVSFCRNTIVGVTSFGSGCGDPNFPGVYSRVTDVKSWIQSTVSGTQDSDCKFCLPIIVNMMAKCFFYDGLLFRWKWQPNHIRPCWWVKLKSEKTFFCYTVGFIKNGTLVFVNFSAQDASILKISSRGGPEDS